MRARRALCERVTAALCAWAGHKQAAAWVSAISGAVTACAVVWAAGAYLVELSTNVSLLVDSPLVVELRCSRTDFDPGRCIDPAFDNEAHLSLTAAFRIGAEGPARAKAAIDGATVTVRFGREDRLAVPHSSAAHELKAFWSANLTPGHEDQQRQVVSLSLAGGESFSREFWFMPIPRLNDDKPAEAAWERADFYSWRRAFIEIGRRALLPDGGHLNPEKLVHIDFSVTWRNGSGFAKAIPQHCTAELGVSVRQQYEAAMVNGEFGCAEFGQTAMPLVTPGQPLACKPDPRALSFTLPCREARPNPSWLSWYSLWSWYALWR